MSAPSSPAPTSPSGAPTARRRGRLTAPAIGLALTLAVLAVYVTAAQRPLFHNAETQTLTWRFQLRGTIEPGPEVLLLMIDDATVARLGQWPLSRQRMAEAVRALAAAGARVVVFDLLFSEPEPALPDDVMVGLAAARRLLPPSLQDLAASIDRIIARGSPDRAFASSLRQAGNVLVPFSFVFRRGEGNVVGLNDRLEEAAYAVYRLPAGERPRLQLAPTGLLAPASPIADGAAWTAHVNVALDSDGSLRYEHPAVGYGGEYFPSLAVQAARAYLDVAKSDMVVAFGEAIRIGDRIAPTDRLTRLPVNHYGPTGTFPTHSFADLLDGVLAPALFRDRIVVIGGSAVGVGDSFPSPFTQTLAAAEYHATVVDNLLHDRTLIKDGRTTLIELAAIVVGGLAAMALGGLGPVAVSVLLSVGLLAGWSAVAFASFAWGNLWLNFVFPAAAIVLNTVCFTAIRALREQRRRRQAERQRRNLARHFSPAVVDALADSDRPFSLDRTQTVAVMFVDIVDFTRRSERLSPAEAMSLLRDFHCRVERAVFAHGGMLDKFLGDGALACFGVPEPGPADAANAIRCAHALRRAVAAWRPGLAATGRPPVDIGIGIHYGPVLMGEVGGERQVDFTVVGDTVNVASRLEGLTRAHGATIVASGAAIDAVRRADGPAPDILEGFEALPPQTVRGRGEPIAAWAWREGHGGDAASPPLARRLNPTA